MNRLTAGVAMSAVAAGLIAASPGAAAQEDDRRFKLTPIAEMTADQKKYVDNVLAGPTSTTGSAAAIVGAPIRGLRNRRRLICGRRARPVRPGWGAQKSSVRLRLRNRTGHCWRCGRTGTRNS